MCVIDRSASITVIFLHETGFPQEEKYQARSAVIAVALRGKKWSKRGKPVATDAHRTNKLNSSERIAPDLEVRQSPERSPDPVPDSWILRPAW